MESVKCRAPWEGFDILYDGKVKCCCWSKVVIGSIHTQSIAEIWNGAEIRRVREKMANGDLNGICPNWCPRFFDRSPEPSLVQGKCTVFNTNLEVLNAQVGQRTITSFPINFRIFPTGRCNLNCIMCGQDHRSADLFLPHLQSDLTNYFPYIRSILAVGGEPLISRHFRRFIQEFDFQLYPDCKFRIITNGTLFNETILQAIPGRFDQVGISIDSIQPEKFEQIRRGASWSRIIGAIEQLALMRGRDFSIYLLFTIMQTNYTEIQDFVRFAKKYDAIPSLNPVLESWHGQQLKGKQINEVQLVLDKLKPADVSNLEGCRAFYRSLSNKELDNGR